MTTAREHVHAAIGAHMPAGVDFRAYAARIDTPVKRTVLLRVDEVRPDITLPVSTFLYTYSLMCVSAFTDDGRGPADEDLDELLEDVLMAVEDTPDVSWTAATRGQWLDTAHPAYIVTIQVRHTKKETP